MDIAWTPTAKRASVRLPEKVAATVVEFVHGALAEAWVALWRREDPAGSSGVG